MTERLTEARSRALKIIGDNPGITPQRFSFLAWPDAPGHNRMGKAGPYGSTRGSGMWIAAGCFLGTIERAGLIRHTRRSRFDNGYELTPSGRSALSKDGE